LLLAINIGNTNVQCGIFDGATLALSERFPCADEFRLRSFLVSCPPAEAVVIGSVNPAACERAVRFASQLLGSETLIAGRDFKIPVVNRARLPEKVGADRLLNSLAAYTRAKKACIVIDIGTAVTIDFVNSRGEFEGGAIMPGPAMSLDALRSRTALLPEVSLPPDVPVLGRDTEGAMASGAFWGTAGAIEKITGMLKQEFGGEAVTFLTGGGAERFAGALGGIDAVVPELTLEGLRLAYEISQR
jgi:type III pantothenate kinase